MDDGTQDGTFYNKAFLLHTNSYVRSVGYNSFQMNQAVYKLRSMHTDLASLRFIVVRPVSIIQDYFTGRGAKSPVKQLRVYG